MTKRFGDLTAVDKLTFTVKRGEVFGLLGPNGAGKTTTIRMLAALLSPSEGSAKIERFDIVTDPIKVRENIGFLPENPNLYGRLTALENMDFFAEAYGITETRRKRERVTELLTFFQLWGRRHDKVAAFSKGMKQKLAIARTLVHKPPILLLDEPTAGLDPETSKNIRELISDLSANENHTIILSTHRMEDAERLCNRVMIINRGRQVISGTPQDLQDRMIGNPPIQVTLKNIRQRFVTAIQSLPYVQKVSVDDLHSRIVIIVDGDFSSVTPEIVKSLVHADARILEVAILRPSLEEAYLKLVKEDSL